MNAAVVHAFDQPPRYGRFDAPSALDGEVVVTVRAAALSQLVRLQASGTHYSTRSAGVPVVPGADGVGVLDDGRRVFFAFPRLPVGSMAERVAVRRGFCVDVPDALDDVTAAALGNPGMSSWAALTERARFTRGESVLINGATGASGRLAIQTARHLGAARVVATGRRPESRSEMQALGADAFITLSQPADELTNAFRQEIHGTGIDVVLDYLWGPSASCLLAAAAGDHASGAAAPRVRYVQIGSMGGATLQLAAPALRSSGLELMGSGLVSVSHEVLVRAMGQALRAAGAEGWTIATEAFPLSRVADAWTHETSRRIVLTP